MQKRKNYSPSFKAKAWIEAIKNEIQGKKPRIWVVERDFIWLLSILLARYATF